MTNKKYSKNYSKYFNLKQDIFLNNDRHLQKCLKLNSFYINQAIRLNCKICDAKLNDSFDIKSHGVGYKVCDNCGHLNGEKEDSIEFINFMYISNDGKDYSENYIDDMFDLRTNEIYKPKLDFLINSIDKNSIRILDIGCGSGYFIAASLQNNIYAKGIDLSNEQIKYGNKNLERLGLNKNLWKVDENEFYNEIINTDCNVISAIGVIEHLREPKIFIEAFKKSKAKYLFYSVPMFSLSVLLENVFNNVYPRQLSGGHTHLFSEKSLNILHEKMGCKTIAEWRFGTDIMDLYRSLIISLKQNNCSDKILNIARNEFENKIDVIQNIFDEGHFCSEIHIVAMK